MENIPQQEGPMLVNDILKKIGREDLTNSTLIELGSLGSDKDLDLSGYANGTLISEIRGLGKDRHRFLWVIEEGKNVLLWPKA